jgi:hypothetical protein
MFSEAMVPKATNPMFALIRVLLGSSSGLLASISLKVILRCKSVKNKIIEIIFKSYAWLKIMPVPTA